MEEKFKTRGELASALGIDRKTFGLKVEKAGIILRPRERISPALQKEIKEKLVDKTTTTTTLPKTPQTIKVNTPNFVSVITSQHFWYQKFFSSF